MDWMYEHRPAWLGRAAMWLFNNTSFWKGASPYLLGVALGRRPQKAVR